MRGHTVEFFRALGCGCLRVEGCLSVIGRNVTAVRELCSTVVCCMC